VNYPEPGEPPRGAATATPRSAMRPRTRRSI
jgi:hypothetical protein